MSRSRRQQSKDYGLKRKKGMPRAQKEMKRAPLKPGTKEMARGKPLERRTPLSRGRWNRNAWEQFSARMASAHAAWKKKVTRSRCAMCAARGVEIDAHSTRDAHHILPARYIRRYVRSLQLPAEDAAKLLRSLLYDHRNGLCLCRRCHDKHETGHTRVPRSLLPVKALQFARELRLDYVIERLYPDA